MDLAIRRRLQSARKNLTAFDGQPLGKAALTVVIVLDLFILSSIFDGLERHTAQLTDPIDYIPNVCRDIYIRQDWNPANRLERLADRVEQQSASYYRPVERKNDLHPACKVLLEKLDAIKDDKQLTNELRGLHRLKREARDLRAKIEPIKGPYDTALLETIAKQPRPPGGVDSIKQEIEKKTAELAVVTQKLANLEASLAKNERIGELWASIDGVSPAARLQLRDELRTLNFWFPLKRLGMELIFLLPLIVAFYLWNSASLRKNRSVQTLVSSHLLVVTVIPIVFKVAELIYDIIPKKLLKHLIELLESLKLVALWNYLIIALAVAVALALIYLFQKKLFSREKMLERRIARNQCQQCGRQLPPGSAVCSFCGFAQFKACAQCGKPTFIYGNFCKECGAAQSAAPAG